MAARHKADVACSGSACAGELDGAAGVKPEMVLAPRTSVPPPEFRMMPLPLTLPLRTAVPPEASVNRSVPRSLTLPPAKIESFVAVEPDATCCIPPELMTVSEENAASYAA